MVIAAVVGVPLHPFAPQGVQMLEAVKFEASAAAAVTQRTAGKLTGMYQDASSHVEGTCKDMNLCNAGEGMTLQVDGVLGVLGTVPGVCLSCSAAIEPLTYQETETRTDACT